MGNQLKLHKAKTRTRRISVSNVVRPRWISSFFQVAAFLVGVMRGKFADEEPQPQSQAQAVGTSGEDNSASPKDDRSDRRSARVSLARRFGH